MRIYFLILLYLYTVNAFAETAVCSISIDTGGTSYNVEANFDFKEGDIAGMRKSFDAPGTNYSCMLTFFGLKSGTMVACENKLDLGETFFASDRTVIKEINPKNNLRFRHEGDVVDIKAECN